jgi:predicted nucleic acid-binding protein
MEQRYLIDTNVIIDNFGNKLPENAKNLLYSIELTLSAVTKIEVLGWKDATKGQLQPLYEFMDIANILPINEAVIEKTIDIRQTKKIALGDAIIAATALVYDLVVISRNTSDFKNIDGLKVVDPYSLP